MVYLILILFTMLQLVSAKAFRFDNATNTVPVNMTTAVSVIETQSLDRFYGDRVHAIVRREDKCLKPDAANQKLRDAQKALRLAAKGAEVVGHSLNAASRVMKMVPFCGDAVAAPFEMAADVTFAAAASMEYAAEAITVDSEELEYAKCAKKEFDEFKKDFNKFKDESEKQFNEIKNQLKDIKEDIQKGFDQTKHQMKLGFDSMSAQMKDGFNNITGQINNVISMLENNKDEQVMQDYTDDMTRITTLNTHLDHFSRDFSQDIRPRMWMECAGLNPLLVLNNVKSKHLRILKTPASRAVFQTARDRFAMIVTDLPRILRMIGACNIRNTSAESSRLFANETGKTAKEIIAEMRSIIKEVHTQTIDDVLPNIFDLFVGEALKPIAMKKLHSNTLKHQLPSKFNRLASSGKKACSREMASTYVEAAKNMYNYMQVTSTWAEVSVFYSYTPWPDKDPNGLDARATFYHFASSDEYPVPSQFQKSFGVMKSTSDQCSFSFMACEKYDDPIRKDNVKRFKRYINEKVFHQYKCGGNQSPNTTDSHHMAKILKTLLNKFKDMLLGSASIPGELPFVYKSMMVAHVGSNETTYSNFISNPMEHRDYMVQGYVCNNQVIYQICF